MSRAHMRDKGQVTIPADIRKAAGLKPGDPVEFEIRGVKDAYVILLRPQKVVDSSQLWFWKPEWQEMEREASEDIAAGRTEFFEDTAAFLESLDE